MARAWVIKKGYQYYDMWSDSFGPLGNATLWENYLVAEEYRQGDPETVVKVEIREVP